MTLLRLDKVQFSSQVDTYLNYDTMTSDLVITGNVSNGTTVTFETEFSYDRTKTRADIYGLNTTTNAKQLITNGRRIHHYFYVSSEVAEWYATYSATNVIVQFRITNNTGGLIALVDQTITIQAILYEVPQ